MKKELPNLIPITEKHYSVPQGPPAFAPREIPQVAIKMSVVDGLCKFALVMDGVEVFAAKMKQKPARKRKPRAGVKGGVGP